MSDRLFMNAQEVADSLGTSKAYAYKLIQKLNEDLEKEGYITIQGRISKAYLFSKVYGAERKEYASVQREKRKMVCFKKVY